ncbi:hypothetical protein AB0F77_06200 [Streptomyces sp. NPDC026672]|uniref:hypothetical protein n=1 Tax=unclassified Streptomyces TaxID=2593676 RepID=UPI0033CDE03F
MRCSTLQSRDDGTCTGTATHLMIYSTPDIDGEQGARTQHTDPVCEPCGDAYKRRPFYKARIVPLHIFSPVPAFKDIVKGHRLVDHPEHESQCHDCGRTGSVEQFKLSKLHGCPARPESVNSRELPQADVSSDASRNELAARWWKYVTHEVGMGIGDWRKITDDRLAVASFTFRDREYVLLHSPSMPYVWAEKLENRGRPWPDEINPEYRVNYKQVVFHFHDLLNRYENTYFATYTPGREDVVLHAPEGAIIAVLRVELDGTGTREWRLRVVTDAVCDTFGAIADLTFQTRIYE